MSDPSNAPLRTLNPAQMALVREELRRLVSVGCTPEEAARKMHRALLEEGYQDMSDRSDMTRDEWFGSLQDFIEWRIKDAPDETCRIFASDLLQKAAEITAQTTDDDDLPVATLDQFLEAIASATWHDRTHLSADTLRSILCDIHDHARRLLDDRGNGGEINSRTQTGR